MSAEHPIDNLVREYLARQEATVDGRQVLAGVRARQGRWRRVGPRFGARRFLLLAAGVLLAVLATLPLLPTPASAETLVREARQAHALDVDRRYRLDIEPEAAMLERFPLLESKQETLWTRGDRFWIEVAFPERRWAWGQDAQERVWLACFPDRGVRFEAEEVPEFLAVGLSVRGLQFETLLSTVLQDFELRRAPAESGTQRVVAELKPGHTHPTLRSAEMEIDPDTKVVKRLVLQRTLRGQDVARVTFTLSETGVQPDNAYELEGHLAEGARIFTNENRPQRMLTLLEHFGPHFGPRLRMHLRSLIKK